MARKFKQPNWWAKGRSQTMANLCVFCGNEAIKMNSERQPVCPKDKERGAKQVECPDCSREMKIKTGKYGYFWGCTDFPRCEKTFNIKQLIEVDD